MSNEVVSPKTAITRRRFIRTLVSAGIALKNPQIWEPVFEAGAVLASGLGPATLGAAIALEGPPVIKRPPPNEGEIYSGSLEDRSGASFFIKPLDKGFFPLERAVLLSNPVIAGGVREDFELASQIEKKGNVPGFGELLLPSYYSSLESFKTATLRKGTNFTLEAGHHAVYKIATFGTLAWFNLKDLKWLGVIPEETDSKTPVREVIWGTEGIGTRLYPRFFGSRGAYDPPGFERAENGKDRFMHVSSHFLVAFLYRYFNEINHPLSGAIPNFLRSAIVAGQETGLLKSPGEEAVFLSSVLGGGYEIQGTILPLNENLPKSIRALIFNESTREGMFDKNVWSDLRANRFAAIMGNKFFDTVLKGGSPAEVAQMFDQPRYKRKETDPIPKPPGSK